MAEREARSGRPVVLVIDSHIHEAGIALLREAGEVRVLPWDAAEEEILARCRDADAFLVRRGRITRRVIEGAPRLRIIARHGIGVDNVDLDAATARGVAVTITGPANAAAVSEYTFALLLALGRHVPTAAAQMKEGRWLPQDHVGVELEGKAMGVVGLGQIGGRVCRHARGFGMRVLGCDPFVGRERARELEVEPVAYDDLLGAADVVSFHVPLTPETRHLLDRSALAKLKPGVRIINTCRGEVIDEAALLEGLRSGVIAGAALDTFEREPLLPDSPLLREPRVLLSPHIAGQTEEALHRMATAAARAILDELEGRQPPFVRNPDAYKAREGRTAGR